MCSSGPVFKKARVTLADSVLEAMPSSLNKAQFLEECFKDLTCTGSDDGLSYSLEGFWTAIVRAHDILITQLEQWKSLKHDTINAFGQSKIIQDSCFTASHHTVEKCENFAKTSSVGKEFNLQERQAVCETTYVCERLICENLQVVHNSNENNHEAVDVIEVLQKPDEEMRVNLPVAVCGTKNSGIDRHPSMLSSRPKTRAICQQAKQKTLSEKKILPRDWSTILNTGQTLSVLDATDIEAKVQERRPHGENIVDEHPDIRLEHNYNHLKLPDNVETDLKNNEVLFENEIYMDIKLSKPNEGIFSDPKLPVTLVVAKEDELQGVEFLQLNEDGLTSLQEKKSSSEMPQTSNKEKAKLKKKKYEVEAPFKYFCNQCSFKTKRHSHMRKHSRFHEKVCTIYSCDQCDFRTIRASHFQRHLGSHNTEVYACSECTYSTYTEDLLSKHQRLKHVLAKSDKSTSKDTYQCAHCNYTTLSDKFIKRHMMKHARKKLKKDINLSCYKCDDCSYQTASRSNYQRHLTSVHGDKRPYMCTTCGVQFKRSDALHQHQITHIKQECEASAHQCNICKKHFRSASALQQHLETHEEVKRYLCEVCGAAFKTKASQRKHLLQAHSSVKQLHACDICSKSFYSKYLLKRHMKVHYPQATLTVEQPEDVAVSSLCHSLVSLPSLPDDVQPLCITDITQSELCVKDGSLFQVTPGSSQGQTLSVPIIPVEYVIEGGDMQLENGVIGTTVPAISTSEGGIITLTFMPGDSSFIHQNLNPDS